MAMAAPDLDTLNEQQLRDLARQLLADTEAQIARKDRLLNLKDTTIAQLKHEIAVLRRFRFDKKSEQVTGVLRMLVVTFLYRLLAMTRIRASYIAPTAMSHRSASFHLLAYTQ